MIIRTIVLTEHFDSDAVNVYYDQRFAMSGTSDQLLLDDGNFLATVTRDDADGYVSALLEAFRRCGDGGSRR